MAQDELDVWSGYRLPPDTSKPPAELLKSLDVSEDDADAFAEYYRLAWARRGKPPGKADMRSWRQEVGETPAEVCARA